MDPFQTTHFLIFILYLSQSLKYRLLSPQDGHRLFSSSIGCTYTNPFDFLDNQDNLNTNFDYNSVILVVTVRNYCAIEVVDTLRLKCLTLFSLSQLHIFL